VIGLRAANSATDRTYGGHIVAHGGGIHDPTTRITGQAGTTRGTAAERKGHRETLGPQNASDSEAR